MASTSDEAERRQHLGSGARLGPHRLQYFLTISTSTLTSQIGHQPSMIGGLQFFAPIVST
jgi:hypothetical protein